VSRYSIEFETPHLAGWIWLVVILLALTEAVRYVFTGRRPRAWQVRAAIIVVITALLATLKIRGWLKLDASSYLWSCFWFTLFGLIWLKRSYNRTTRQVDPIVKTALVGLRLMTGMLIMIMLTGPTCKSVSVRHERAVLGILLDNSRSMNVEDVVIDDEDTKTLSRIDSVRWQLDHHQKAVKHLADELDLRWYLFDSELTPTESPEVMPEGSFTALLDSVQQAYEILTQQGSQSTGLMVISDGRDNFSSQKSPLALGQTLAQAGVPVYAVGVGSEVPAGQLKGLQARRLNCPARVSVLNRLDIGAEFFAAGLKDMPVSLEIFFDDEQVGRREIRPGKITELIRADFAHTPSVGGLHRVTVRAAVVGSNDPQGKAELSQYVRVIDDKIRVLYIDRARYERATIARSLEPAKELYVRKMDLNQPMNAGVSPALQKRSGMWSDYHVILLGDIDRRAFPDAVLNTIAQLVAEKGRGLAMLGGLRTLGTTRYFDTPLNDVMPVQLNAVGHWSDLLEFELTPEGLAHAICQLDSDPTASESVWKRLPPFTGASRLGEVKPAGQVLLRTSAGKALLVVQEVGKGRTAAVAFDSTWRWSFADDAGVEAQQRFWRQLVMWLANWRPEVWVISTQPRYDLARLRRQSQKVILEAGLAGPSINGIADQVTFSGMLTGPDDQSISLNWVKKEDYFEAVPSVRKAGTYKVTAKAHQNGRTIGQSETAFIVESVDMEMAEPLASPQTLMELAGPTNRIGGQYVPIQQFGKLLDQIDAADYTTEITQINRDHLVYDHPWGWLSLFVLLMTMEWIIRKGAGLI